MSTSVSPPTTPSSPRPILQPRIPTGLSPHSDSPAVRIPADNHGSKADIDPTEWKPKSTRNGRPIANRYNSEAFRYLSSFHRAINKDESNEYNDTPNEFKIDIRDISAALATAPTTPSLGNTPTTTASSWSMSTSVDYAGHGGYDFNTRPLMPRQHNRWYSTSAISAAGIDLVTPHIPPPKNAYAKKDVEVGAETPKGGLGAFFGGQVD